MLKTSIHSSLQTSASQRISMDSRKRTHSSWNYGIPEEAGHEKRPGARSEQYQFDYRVSAIKSHSDLSHRNERRSSNTSTKSRGNRKSGWARKAFPCCKDIEDSDSSENDDIEKRIRDSGGTAIEEKRIIARLEEAVNQLDNRPTSHEIESEIIKWHKALEMEQNLYEESGRPKFKYMFFRKNKYLIVREHPLYGTAYENHRKLEARLKRFRGKGSIQFFQRFLPDKVVMPLHHAFSKYLIKRQWRRVGVKSGAGDQPAFESRFVAELDAPSQTNSYPVRSSYFEETQESMAYIHHADQIIKERFIKLLQFKQVQTKWIHYLIGVLMAQRKVASIPELVRRIQYYQKYHNNKVDIRFLKKALEQFTNLTFTSAVEMLQNMPMHELLPYLADELIFQTTFHLDEYHYHYGELVETSSESDHDDNNNDRHDVHDTPSLSSSSFSTPVSSSSSEPSWLTESGTPTKSSSSSTSTPTASSSSSSASSLSIPVYSGRRVLIDYQEMHRKILGMEEKTLDELRILLTIRLKKGLDLPIDVELELLKLVRRKRAQRDRENACWTMNDRMPIDHFIPASISKKNETICFTVFHAVVVEGEEHFVLRKLPIPRPPIVRVTKAFIANQKGASFTDRISTIVKSRMFRNIKQIVNERNLKSWSKEKVKEHLVKVTDRIDDDVYNFLDPILTCIVVVYGGRNKVSDKVKDKMYYLTARTRRKLTAEDIYLTLKRKLPDFEITTYNSFAKRQMYVKNWMDLLEAPPDIVYHFGGSSSEESIAHQDDEVLDVHSSSGSSSSLPSGQSDLEEQRNEMNNSLVNPGFYSDVHYNRRSKYVMTPDSMNRDRRDSIDDDDKEFLIKKGEIKHISAKRWKRNRRNSKLKKFAYTPKELKLQEAVDVEAERRAGLDLPKGSKSMESLMPTRAGKGVHPQRSEVTSHFHPIGKLAFLEEDSRMSLATKGIAGSDSDESEIGLQEDKLMNDGEGLKYISIGKLLIVEAAEGGLTSRRHTSHYFTHANDAHEED